MIYVIVKALVPTKLTYILHYDENKEPNRANVENEEKVTLRCLSLHICKTYHFFQLVSHISF